MIRLLKANIATVSGIVGVIFLIAPESIFNIYKILPNISDGLNIVLNRSLVFIITFFLTTIVTCIYREFRRHVEIKGKNYIIRIEEKNLFDMDECKKVIPFDECFTTKVGDKPYEINPSSICGQYIKKYAAQDQVIQDLIRGSQLCPMETGSRYKNKTRYESGRLLQQNDYLLMSFAKLDESGLGVMTRGEYIACLEQLWSEIDKYYGQKDVCIPILGSGVTRMDDTSLTQQELLDIIVESYKLSIHKIKAPHKLHIVYKRCDNFSLNKIGESI